MIPWTQLQARFDEIGMPVKFCSKEEQAALPNNHADAHQDKFREDFHEWLDGRSCMVFFVKPDKKFEICFTERLAKKFWDKYDQG